jgi:hypothetical protein
MTDYNSKPLKRLKPGSNMLKVDPYVRRQIMGDLRAKANARFAELNKRRRIPHSRYRYFTTSP